MLLGLYNIYCLQPQYNIALPYFHIRQQFVTLRRNTRLGDNIDSLFERKNILSVPRKISESKRDFFVN